MLEEMGAVVYDADKIIHGFYKKGSPVLDRVVELLGPRILDEEGNGDRRKIADAVFSDRKKLTELEKITHEALYEELERRFSRLPEDSLVFVEAALVIEKGTYRKYDKTVVVWAPYEVCLERALGKGMSEEDFKRRWQHQMDMDRKAQLADFVIDNSDGIERTRDQVREMFKKLRDDP